MKKTVIVVGASLLMLQAAAAAAAEPGSTLSERVAVADLNLNSEEGLATLDRRIHAAARRVCSDSHAGATMPSLYIRLCVRGAVSAANRQRDRLVSMAKQADWINSRTSSVSTN